MADRPEQDDQEFWPADVHLLDTTTGERAVYRSEHEMDDPDNPGEFAEFCWREGNFSCDCNRSLFFARALGRPDDVNKVSCGDGRFVVEQIVRLSDGATVYRDAPVEGWHARYGEPVCPLCGRATTAGATPDQTFCIHCPGPDRGKVTS